MLRYSWLLFVFLAVVGNGFSQQPIGNYAPVHVPDPLCHYCNYRLPQDASSVSDPNYAYKHHAPTCPYYPKENKVQNAQVPTVHVPSQNDQIKQMVTGMIMQSLITAVFSSNTQQTQQEQWEAQQAELAKIAEAAKQKKIQDSIAQVKHDKMMGLYKPLEGSVGDLGFKTLDGEMEAMRSGAGAMFDQGVTIDKAVGEYAQGTNFFGTMSDQDIQLLFEPDNDPMLVDLREAKAVLQDTGAYGKMVQDLKRNDPTLPKKPQLSEEECERIQSKVNRDIDNKQKYEATIDKTIEELNRWKEENNAALMSAFREGLGFLTGQFVDIQNKKYEPAQNLKNAMQKVLEKEPNNKTAKELIAFLDNNHLNQSWREKMIRAYNDAKDADAVYEVMRDAMQNTLAGFSAADQKLIEMLESSELKPYLNDEAFMSACKFTAKSIFEMAATSEKATKALESVFKAKIPYVSIAQFAINQAYNATQWYYSRKAILELNQVHGKELETAQYLQNRIFTEQLKLDQQCQTR